MKFLSLVFSGCISFLLITNSAQTMEAFLPLQIEAALDVETLDQSHEVNLRAGRYNDLVPPPPLLNYVPLIIKNNTGLDASRLYVFGKGQKTVNGGDFFLQPDLTTGICSLVSNKNSADSSISVQLSKLPTSGTDSYKIYIPKMISGRLYISIDSPLYLKTSTSGGNLSISDPSQTSVQDPNYYTLYQDLEFTLDNTYNLYTNVTNVDYFCLPMTLSSHSQTNGGKLYPTIDGLTVVGYPTEAKRSNILKNINAGLSPVAEWANLPVPYYDNPYTDTKPSTTLRILAAKLSIPLGQNNVQFKGAKVPQAAFDPNYLQNSTLGPMSNTDYMTALYNHYKTNSLTFLIHPDNLPTTTYTMSSSSTANTLNFVPKVGQSNNPPTRTLNLSNLSTGALLSGAVGEWTTAFNAGGTDAYNTEISKLLSALFTAGFLPHPNFLQEPVDSQASYYSPYRNRYFNNPTGFDLNGPWYNLYNGVIHPLLIKTNNYGLGYAYDFDDLLDIAGLIHVIIQTSGTLNSAHPYPKLWLGPVDTTIPNPKADFGPYNLTVNGGLPSGSKPISIIYSTVAGVAPNITKELTTGTTPTLTNLQNYFIVQYSGIAGETLRYYVYPKYQLVLPSTTRYNETDAALTNGLVFNSANGTSFAISLPNTKNY